MITRRTRDHSLGKRDARGRIRQVVGYKADGKKARIQVADKNTSEFEAKRRLQTVRTLYEGQCERYEIERWLEWAYRVAVMIGAGEEVTDGSIAGDPTHVAAVISQMKAWGITVAVEDEQVRADGIVSHHDEIMESVQHLVKAELERQLRLRGAIASEATMPGDILALADTRSFHESLDEYSKHLKATGKRNDKGNLVTRVGKCCDRLRYLQEHHSDFPLWKLNLPKLETMAAYWRNRPATRKADRCSKDHATDMLKELWRFLRWLDKHPDYRWLMPRGGDEIKRSPVSLPEDENGEAFQTITKETYSPDQLAKILRFTDGFGRTLISVCVNCAFGASEIGQWPTSLFSLHTAHPHAHKLEFPSTAVDSWIVGKRPKTKVYGEHLLWPQVGEALTGFIDGRSVLPMTSVETPWYKTHSSNPQSKFTNWWNHLIEKVQRSDEKFPHLPFGSLRDVLPDILRSRYSDDVASLALQHGEIGDDNLLKHYANHPYKRLFEATKELESYFKPMLDELARGRR